MEKILQTLREYFRDAVQFPAGLSKHGIVDDLNSGWYVRYIVETNEDGEPFLDFVAEHRMTNPRHARITADGQLQYLEMYMEAFSYNPAMAGDEELQKEKYYEHNRNVSRILIKKGLMDLKGNELLFQ